MLLLAVGCATAEIPYAYPTLDRTKAPAHDLIVAIEPFVDARGADAGEDAASGFSYRGTELTHTDLGDLARSPGVEITQVVARHLALGRVFRQVVLVLRASQAPEADLVLTGRVRRARGYVGANPTSTTGPDRRTVMAEVLLEGVELREPRGANRTLLAADVGWSILEERPGEPELPSPWSVLADGLRVTVDQLQDVVESADLSGEYFVRESVAPTATGTVAFVALSDVAPFGWRGVADLGPKAPLGWDTDAPRCEQFRFVERQQVHFHRALGPYRPTVILWRCPRTARMRYDPMTELPAEFLGVDRSGANILIHAVGRTNWPTARADLLQLLALTPPSQRYIFELGE